MTKHWPIATFINMATVTIGSLIGMWLGHTFPEELRALIFQIIGLCTLFLGLRMAWQLPDGYLIVLIIGMLLGGVLGWAVGLGTQMEQLSGHLQAALGLEDGGSRFTEGLITAFLLFCIGAMTILGAVEEGLYGRRELLLIKATLDGITSIAFAATYGIGVLFSIVPMLLLQGGITLSARRAAGFFTKVRLGLISAAGGLMIIGIGFNLLDIADIAVEDLLPALLTVLLVGEVYAAAKKRWFP